MPPERLHAADSSSLPEAGGDLFSQEQAMVERSQSVLADSKLSLEELRHEYVTLAREFKNLVRQTTKLTRISDGNEKRLLKAQKELEQAESKYRNIYEQTFEGLYQISLDGRYLNANPAMFRIFGITDPTTLEAFAHGREGVGFLDQSARQRFLVNLNQIGMVVGFESRIRRPDKAERWVSENARAVCNEKGKVVYFEGSVADITDRKEVEQAMHQAKEAAEAAADSKSQFLATMSHEIRTPMNGVLGMSTLLLESELKSEQYHYATVVKQSAEALLVILNDILDFSKIEAGKLSIEQIDFELPQVLNGVAALLEANAKAKGLYLQTEWPPEIPRLLRGDPYRLRQILMNLLNNAIKFTEDGGVTVKVLMEERTENRLQLLIQVVDTGIGLTEDSRKKLFQAFAQADASTTRKFGGTGLGLAICRKLVELMGGTIGVDSVIGQGSTFWFRLPLEIEDATPASTSVDKSSGTTTQIRGQKLPVSSRAMKLLLVDDSPTNLEVGSLFLGRMGHTVKTALDGQEALEKWQAESFDAVLMDCEMPVMDGYAAARQIRTLEAVKGLTPIPVVAMTAWAMLGDREKCLQAGMDDYVGKPIDVQALHQALERCIERLNAAGAPKPVVPVVATAPPVRAKAKKIVLNGTSVSVNVVETFLRELPTRLEKMKQTRDQHNLAELAEVVHLLRGTLTIFGSEELVELMNQIEYQARQGDLGVDGGAKVERAIEQFTLLETNLRRLV